MSGIHEQLSEQFHQWELRGRGWHVFDEPIFPEPPFIPFAGHHQSEAVMEDNGRKPGLLGSLLRGLGQKLTDQPPPIISEPAKEPEPIPLTRDSLIEFQASLPEKLDVSAAVFEQFLLNLSLCREPISFELLGTHKKVIAQFAAADSDASLVRRQLTAYFPEAVFVANHGALESAWETSAGDEMLAVEFGLAREFMLPLGCGQLDPFIGIVGALSELQPSELGLFQVLWQPVHHPWAESILNSVTDSEGKPFFIDSPELASAAGKKIESPLFAAIVRILVRTKESERLLQLSRDLAGSLRVFADPKGNELIPLTNDDYGFEEHIEDVLRRQTRRSGMLLNSDELIGFVHLPSTAVRSPALQRQVGKTKAVPHIARHGSGLLLGSNEHGGETVEVRLSAEQRTKHCHIIGASGTGKSTLLFNLIRQDIENGEGVAVLDPHGDLIDRILGIIPESRIDDVVLVDPSDAEYSVGFNILSAHSDLEKNLLASDLIAVFQRLSTSWGDQMNSVLQNAILAFLESDRRGTIADLRRFLIETPYRNDFLKSVKDAEVVYYWQKSFPHLSGNKSIGSILTRLDTFLAQKPIRHMVSQPENRLDFAHIMDRGKIFLAKLPEGLLGKENSYLFGTLLVSKFQQIAMARQNQEVALRKQFWIYIDEFANFITPSMAEILSGARKYRIGLTLAHHELQQLERDKDVASAVMSHPYTRIVFRVGDEDVKKLGEGFAFFEAKDLRNLETGQAVARIERSDYDFNLSIPLPDEVDKEAATVRRQEVITGSRKKYGTARAEVEAMLAKSRTASGDPPEILLAPAESILPPQTRLPGAAEVVPLQPSPPLIPERVKAPKKNETMAATQAALGKGGAQHKAVQQRIKEAAEALGFRSVIEKQIAGSQESVDLLLERGDQSIACEISIRTTIDHEVGNVAKCLKAGFSKVAVICLDEERLKKIEAAVSGSLGKEQSQQVSYHQPDQFIAHLKTLPSPIPTVEVRRGYKIKRSFPKLTPEERQQKEAAALHLIAEVMRQKPK